MNTNPDNLPEVYVVFGGSHRRNKKCLDAIAQWRIGSAYPAELYSKKLRQRVIDTPEMRAVLKLIGGGIAKRQ